jgi:hypothetical protein
LDIHVVRCAELSPLNEAEHLNGVVTSAVTMAEAPSVLAAGVPKNSAELKRIARAFGQALTNAISGGEYGGANINSIYSHPDLPPGVLEKSETIKPAMRLAMRAINERWPMPMAKSMPMADQTIVPVKVYQDTHLLCGHYSNQLSRFACRVVLGRLCCRDDYAPFHEAMPFLPCTELAYLESDNRLCSSFISDAKKKPDGHYESYEEVRVAVAAGTRVVTYQEPPQSIELKRYFKEKSQLPSSDEVARLARGVYQDVTEKGREVIMEVSRSGVFQGFFCRKRSAKVRSALQRAFLSPWRRRSCGSWTPAPQKSRRCTRRPGSTAARMPR